MTNLISILFVLPTLDAGGAENYALRFIKYTKAENLNFHILSVKTQKGDLHDEFINVGCKVYYQSIGYFNIIKFYHFYKLLKKVKINTICTFTGNFGGMPIFIARLAGLSNRIAWHRRSTNAFGNNFFKLAYNSFVNLLIRQHATNVFSNSKTAFENFYGNYADKDTRFKVLPNGVDASVFFPADNKHTARTSLNLPTDKIIIGHVGRYDPAKNHETIFKVISSLKLRNLNCIFLFCGKGTDSENFKSRLISYGIEDVCILLGLSNSLPLVYQSLDLFYFPSVTEGQPNALLEAYATDLAVVTSNIPPILEVLPVSAHEYCLNPLDVAKASMVIEELIINSNLQDTYKYRNWVIKNFDFSSNLNLFLQELSV